jgi:hypothetical protein
VTSDGASRKPSKLKGVPAGAGRSLKQEGRRVGVGSGLSGEVDILLQTPGHTQRPVANLLISLSPRKNILSEIFTTLARFNLPHFYPQL